MFNRVGLKFMQGDHLTTYDIYYVHTVNFGSEMLQAKHVSGKNTFCCMNREKIREEKIFEIVHCPFEG